MADQLKSTMDASFGSTPSPKGGAGSNGGPLNSQGDSGVIQTNTFITVPAGSGSGEVQGAFQDKLQPGSISTGPAGGSARPSGECFSSFDAPFGRKP
jgi:hypothetical protein